MQIQKHKIQMRVSLSLMTSKRIKMILMCEFIIIKYKSLRIYFFVHIMLSFKFHWSFKPNIQKRFWKWTNFCPKLIFSFFTSKCSLLIFTLICLNSTCLISRNLLTSTIQIFASISTSSFYQNLLYSIFIVFTHFLFISVKDLMAEILSIFIRIMKWKIIKTIKYPLEFEPYCNDLV